MNVLLVNPAFHESFYSYHKVVKLMGRKAIGPPLGLITVAALLPGDWNLTLRDLNFDTISEMDWNDCDLVMITGTAFQASRILDVIREAKNREKVVVVGGPWAFHFPYQGLEAGADLIVKGEAELIVDELLERIERKQFGVVITSDKQVEMKDVPIPRYDLLKIGMYWSITIQFSRGCPYKCEYCDITHMYGRRFRTKTPEQVLNELSVLYDLGWRGSVFFVDDSFTGVPKRTKELMRAVVPWMESRHMPFEFRTQAVASLAEDDDLLNLLVTSGFVSVYVGIDSTDVGTLEQTRKFHHASMDLDSAMQKMNRAGLAVFAGFMIGFDHEMPGVDNRVIDFVKRNNIPEVLVSPLMAVPGTELWTRLEEEGRLYDDSEDLAKINRLHNFVPKRPVEEIAKEMIHIYEEVYEPEDFLQRSFEHMSRMPRRSNGRASSKLGFGEMVALGKMLIKHGAVYPSRFTFWKCLMGTLLKRRDQLGLFFHYVFFVREFFDFRTTGVKESLKQGAG
jgi:radical SAM superfamily enzyme YgiQ (UPF0313 family)